MSHLDQTLLERGARYGDFSYNAEIAQSIKRIMRRTDGWHYRLSDVHREALDIIADKISRILVGDPDYMDNWHDIAGYAKLAEDRCQS